jgi:hypothetical protein
MAGVGYGKWESVKIAQTYGFLFSSKKYDDNARDWTEKGWASGRSSTIQSRYTQGSLKRQ